MSDKPVAICLDFDGTVVRADELILSATRQGFANSGLQIPTDDQVFQTVGLSLEEVVLYVHPDLPDSRVEATVEQLLRAFTEERERTGGEKFLKPIQGFDGFISLAEKLKIPLGVVSSKPKHSLEFAVEGLGLGGRFTHVISTADFSPKPDPSALIEFFDRILLPKGQCVYIGDSVVDGMMALNAGTNFWGAAWGYSGRTKLEDNGFDTIFDNFRAVTSHLSSLK